jgi:hypothetical protein
MDDRTAQASKVRINAMSQIRSIQDDKDLSPEGKARQIAQIRSEANKTLTDLRMAHEEASFNEREAIFRKLFGLSFKPMATDAERVMARLSYRDAIFRADGIANVNEASAMLKRSRLVGDKDMIKAIALRAYTMNWSGILSEYANEGRDIADALDDLSRGEGFNKSRSNLNSAVNFSKIPETKEERSIPAFRNAA